MEKLSKHVLLVNNNALLSQGAGSRFTIWMSIDLGYKT